MLYEILTGRVPFEARNPVKLFHKILSDEPARPGRLARNVKQDLEVICLKAIEKDPARRYPTAAEFADDLELFRRGRPIVARASSLAYRIQRNLLRRKGAVAVSSASALAVLALLLFASSRVGREREEALRQMRGRLDTVLRAALDFRRAGDLAKMRTFAREAEGACADAVRVFPESAEPHALLGRVYRALMDTDKALAEGERALAKDPGCARARYERVVLTARLYRKRGDELVEQAWRRAGERLGEVRGTDLTVPSREALAKEDPVARNLRRRMEDDLRVLEAKGDGDIGPGERACARGMLAWLAGNRTLARKLLQEAVKEAPLLEEGYEALAALETEERRYEEAALALTAGLERDRGYLPHLENRALTRLTWGYDRAGRGEEAKPLYREAIADYTTLLELDPARDESYRNRGLAYFLDGHFGGFLGRGDPRPLYEAAVHDFSKAIEVNPRGPANWMWRGVVRVCWGTYKGLKLEGALPLCEEALRDLTEAIRLNPEGDEAYMWRALARAPIGVLRAAARQDPEPLYRESLRDFEECLRRNPGRGEAWMWRGVLHTLWALHQLLAGRDAAGVFRLAVEDLEVAVEKLPERSDPAEWRGRAESLLGLVVHRTGGDGSDHFRKAAGYFDRALAVNPNSPTARWGRGEARMRLGAFDDALRDFGDAAEPYARGLRGEALVGRAQAKAARGEDPEPDLTAALAEFRSALEGNPLLTDSWIWQGRARTLLATLRAPREDPLPRLQEAIGDFSRVLFFNPDHVLALQFRAEAYERRGSRKASAGRSGAADFQAALKDYERLLQLAPALEPRLRPSVQSCRSALPR
jgi:tetratricopeptide (TPR) repeat protein